MCEVDDNSCEGCVTKNNAFFLCMVCKRSKTVRDDYYCSEEQYKKNMQKMTQDNLIDKEVNDD